MITIRQIEKLWDARRYEALSASLLQPRVEGALAEELKSAGSIAAAALAMIRMDELNQTHVPLFGKMIRALIAGQQADGGWGDVAVTAMCLRALAIDDGHGEAMGRAMAWLAGLQQPDGIWPRVPIRRMPADAEVSALILMELGGSEEFRQAARVDEAIEWFEHNADTLSATAKKLWAHGKLRCKVGMMAGERQQEWMWS